MTGMDIASVRAIADAVLYEGYVLYPYRASSVKNRHRWTFGGLLPRAWAAPQGELEPWRLESQCLVEGDVTAEISVKARFLHLVRRSSRPSHSSAADAPAGPVEAWREEWEEGVPREIDAGPIALLQIASAPMVHRFEWPSERHVVAGVTREQRAIAGELTLHATSLGDRMHRVVVRVANLTEVDAASSRGDAILSSLASTHVVLGARGGDFVSLIDPPEHAKDAAAACTNASAWPVLVGDDGARDRLLCSPIILYDYPKIASESPGDLFDGTEIDEILTLRILTLTDAEKREMAATDERARALLERTEALGPKDLARLHGALRAVHAGAPFVRPLRAGDRVILRPRVSFQDADRLRRPSFQDADRLRRPSFQDADRLRRPLGADVMDLALAGKRATVTSIEHDFENGVHVAVTVDDDPGRDLGAEGKAGHRFFFREAEVERVADILVAGIGNVFLGDDGFGVEVAQRLLARAQPDGIRVVDFGIRGLDLAWALETCGAAILVDATPRGGAPGTVYVIEPDVAHIEAPIEGHTLTPERVLASIAPARRPKQVRLVGCEPLSLDPDEDGLSAPVRGAVDEAVRVVEALARRWLATNLATGPRDA